MNLKVLIVLISISMCSTAYAMKIESLCDSSGAGTCHQSCLGNDIMVSCSYSQIMSDDNPPIPTNMYDTDCHISFSNSQGEIFRFKESTDMERNATVYWGGADYAEIRTEADAQQTYSVILNFKKMTHTPLLQDVYGIDSKRKLIALNAAYRNQPNDFNSPIINSGQILITNLYDHSRGLLIDFPADAEMSLSTNTDTNFDDQGNLILDYLTKSYAFKKVVIPIDTSKFVALDPVMIQSLGLNFSAGS
jgi:hypothetical protein